MLLETRPLMFFGGKGGVGKTTVAAATALRHAATGVRTLLVSTDPAHNLGHIWGAHLRDTPTNVESNLDIIELDPAHTTQTHLRNVEANMRDMLPERMQRAIREHLNLARTSPGMHEAAFTERLAEITTLPYERIVVDTAPSGHTTRLLAMPEIMAAYTEGLLERRTQSDKFSELVGALGGTTQRRNQRIRSTLLARRRKLERLRDTLTDPAHTNFHIVLTAERLPVLESGEFAQALAHIGMRLGGLVINRRSPRDAGDFLAQRHRAEEEALRLLPPFLLDAPRIQLPLFPTEIGTRQALEHIAQHL